MTVAADGLSRAQRHTLWVSCMASDVPVPLTDPGAVERVASLMRSPRRPGTQHDPGLVVEDRGHVTDDRLMGRQA